MTSSGSGKQPEKFLTGKGFYIVLFLCAAVIGVSAWMMAAGEGTMSEDKTNGKTSVTMSDSAVAPVSTPGTQREQVVIIERDSAETAPVMNTDGISAKTGDSDTVETVRRMGSGANLSYQWPVTGTVERYYTVDALSYDYTMRDWRTHNAIDIVTELGAPVYAAHRGTVASITNDEFYGTTVVVDHGDGTQAIYSNLEVMPAVSAGDWVEPGTLIGSVGTTALCEVGQSIHLHFAMKLNGEDVNPLNYLP